MVDSPYIVLRVVFVVHFILTVWASMSECLFGNGAVSYVYMNSFILLIGLWAIVCPDSVDALFMFFVLLAVSILMDIIFLGVYATLGQQRCEALSGVPVVVNTYRFSLGMAILNLLLKPLTSFIVFRLYQDHSGQVPFSITISGSNSMRSGGYSDIEHSSHPQHVETAVPYSTVDKSPAVHQ